MNCAITAMMTSKRIATEWLRIEIALSSERFFASKNYANKAPVHVQKTCFEGCDFEKRPTPR